MLTTSPPCSILKLNIHISIISSTKQPNAKILRGSTLIGTNVVCTFRHSEMVSMLKINKWIIIINNNNSNEMLVLYMGVICQRWLSLASFLALLCFVKKNVSPLISSGSASSRRSRGVAVGCLASPAGLREQVVAWVCLSRANVCCHWGMEGREGVRGGVSNRLSKKWKQGSVTVMICLRWWFKFMKVERLERIFSLSLIKKYFFQ